MLKTSLLLRGNLVESFTRNSLTQTGNVFVFKLRFYFGMPDGITVLHLLTDSNCWYLSYIMWCGEVPLLCTLYLAVELTTRKFFCVMSNMAYVRRVKNVITTSTSVSLHLNMFSFTCPTFFIADVYFQIGVS